MQSSNRVHTFIEEVCEQICWKKSHKIVSKELENHIEDQFEENIKLGMSEDEATEKAIEEMGNGTVIGLELNEIHRPKSQWKLILTFIFLSLGGLFLRYQYLSNLPIPYYYIGDLRFTIVGIVIMVLAYYINLSTLLKNTKLIYIVTFVITILLMIPIGKYNGAYTLAMRFVVFYPLVFVLVVYSQRGRGYEGYIRSILLMLPLLILALLVRYSSALLLFGISILVILAYALKEEWFKTPKIESFIILIISIIFISVFLFLVYKLLFPQYIEEVVYNKNLLLGNTHPFALVYQTALSGSKFIGRGEFTGGAESLPMYETNGFLTYLILKLGWIFFVFLLVLIVSFAYGIFKLSKRYNTKFGNYISLSIISTFVLQFMLYALFNLGIGFFPPLSLPFISYGSTLQLVNFLLLGILLSTFRHSGIIEDILPDQKKSRTVS
ncbi:permease prefix domain 1-containing protein [Anaerosphaera multitolerans]|nr:permease prefix domain 1-containing protein [Anaerosphaera multitolerans]